MLVRSSIYGVQFTSIICDTNFRITNKGLVDVNSMKIEPLFE